MTNGPDADGEVAVVVDGDASDLEQPVPMQGTSSVIAEAGLLAYSRHRGDSAPRSRTVRSEKSHWQYCR